MTVSAGDDLTLNTKVDNLAVTFTKPGNLTVTETAGAADANGNVTFTSIAMDNTTGGDITIVADGNIRITSITGKAGKVSITSLHGSIIIDSMSSAGEVVLSAAQGTVTAGTTSIAFIEADTLDIIAKGAINIYEKDVVSINRIASSDGAAITVTAGGNLTLKGAITTTGSNAVKLLTTAGSLALEQPITTASGSITLTAAGAMSLDEQADLTSVSGNISLLAGADTGSITGSMTLTGETFVDAGSGLISFIADGDVTLGKLRTTNTSDLVITSHFGGVIDGGDSPPDIVAAGATLKVRSVTGFGSFGSAGAVEIQVAALDVINTASGNIAVEEVDGIILYQISQSGIGNVSVSTLNGAISTVYRAGTPIDLNASTNIQSVVKADSGSISLYAGGTGGVIALGANADISSSSDASHGISLTAEDGNITLAGGIRVAGAGNITLRALRGSVLVDHNSTGWRQVSGSFDPQTDWAMRLGKFVTDPASGELRTANVEAYNLARINNGVVLRAAGGAYLQTTDGRLTITALSNIGETFGSYLYSPYALVVDAAELNITSAERMNVSVIATANVNVVANAGSGSKGGTTGVSTFTGEQTISDAVDASGDNITITANSIELDGALRSAGAVLTITTIDVRCRCD